MILKMFQSLFKKEPRYNCTVAFSDFTILHMTLNEFQINEINWSSGMYIVNQDEVQRNIARNKKERSLNESNTKRKISSS